MSSAEDRRLRPSGAGGAGDHPAGRGEDHVTNTALQIQMFEALGRQPAQFAHEALLVATEGKLSKRLGSYGAEHMRAEGVEPMAMLSVLARIGTSQAGGSFAAVEPVEDR